MYTKSFEYDLKLWIKIAVSTLGYGHNIKNSRLYVLYQMIEWRLGINGIMHEDKHKALMQTLSRICEFAKREEVTSSEKDIYLHIFIDLAIQGLPRDEESEWAWKLLQRDIKSLPLETRTHFNGFNGVENLHIPYTLDSDPEGGILKDESHE